MSFQSVNILARGLSYIWEASFGFVGFCGFILVIGLISQIIKICKKDTVFKLNKLSVSFFIISPIIVTSFLIAELFWRINAFYGVSTFYVSYWYEYLIFTVFNFLLILGIWIGKNLFTNGFLRYKQELIEMKKSLINFYKKIIKLFLNIFILIKKIIKDLPKNFKKIKLLLKDPSPFFQNKKPKNKILDIVYSPIEGKVISLDKVKDEAFSQKLLGDGFAIVPDLNKNEFKAPVEGKIETIFHTNHAYGIKTKNGTNVLIHIGLNTVELKGKYFKQIKKVGDKVKVGDLIIKADLKKIKSKGFDITTVVVCTPDTKGKINIKTNNFNKEYKKSKGLIKIS